MASTSRRGTFWLRTAAAATVLIGSALPQSLPRDDAVQIAWGEAHAIGRRLGLDADELAQTVAKNMLEAKTDPLSFDEQRLRRYARGAAQNTGADMHKKRSRSMTPLTGLEVVEDVALDEVDYRDWLGSLDQQDRRIWELRHESGLSNRAVAQRIRASRPTTSRSLARSRKSFGKHFGASALAILACIAGRRRE